MKKTSTILKYIKHIFLFYKDLHTSMLHGNLTQIHDQITYLPHYIGRLRLV